MASARSENASSTSAGAMWARPNDRMPGVSITHPDPCRGSATDWVEVCLPLPTPDTTPTARKASGTRRFTNVDLPTPEWPRNTVTLLGDQLRDPLQRIGSSRRDDRQVQPCELRGERLGVGEVGLGEAQNGGQATRVGGDQRALDEADARGWIGQRDHDEQLIRVGDDDPLGRIGVICGTPQYRSAFVASDDPRERVGPARYVADDPHLVADHDRCPAELPGAHRGDDSFGISVERAAPPSAIDRDDHRVGGVGVLGPGLGPRTRAASGAHPDVGLVLVVAWSQAVALSMSAHIRGKSGSVLAVVPMSSTSTPGTRSPTMAPAVAMRWSA